MPSATIDRYMESLLAGDRNACRRILQDTLAVKTPAQQIFEDVLWPAMERVDKLFRKDRINIAVEHMATRINRSLADQLQPALTRKPSCGRTVLIMCASGEPEEMGAQMCSDLFEADGWEVYFVGGGIPHDEVVSLIGMKRPDLLLLFGTQPHGVPDARVLVDMIRDIGANPAMNIMVSGGVFNRADGLWREINADLFAPTMREALEMANQAEPRAEQVRIPGAPKKRRRRRSPVLATA